MSGGKQSLVETKKFSDQAFDSIPFYSVACFFSYGYSQPFHPLGIAAYNSCKVFGTIPHPLLIYSSESAFLSDPFRFPVR
jgi:hypothetical protein